MYGYAILSDWGNFWEMKGIWVISIGIWVTVITVVWLGFGISRSLAEIVSVSSISVSTSVSVSTISVTSVSTITVISISFCSWFSISRSLSTAAEAS